MKVLLVKTSSMGDVVHTLTAVREAKTQRPDLTIDWLVESSFADVANIAQANGDIHRVIPIQFRRWRKKKPFGLFFNADIKALKHQLRQAQYDVVLDAQGLLKSLFLARLAAVPIAGFDHSSAREGIAARFYHHVYPISKNQHAITRLRQLFAQVLKYPLLSQAPSIKRSSLKLQPTILLLHGTTWDNKAYPTPQWHNLAKQLSADGYKILIPHHGEAEYRVATAIADGIANAHVLPEQRIEALMPILQSAAAVVSVDTGLAHLAVYLGVPTVMLFGPTRTDLTGGIGGHTANIIGKATDTASMKREYYHQPEQFAPSMQAISVTEIREKLRGLAQL